MENINGEWIMKGCDPSSPSALHNIEDAVSLITKIGFLPLFSNTIPGFSVEEHVPADRWWTGNKATDPWEWRILLCSHPEIAYGKFFNRAAGFISKDFFPVFANYRRDGYDFEALFEDELAPHRSKKIMDVFELDDESIGKELMTYQVRELAAFGKRTADGKSGEKNFDGVLTELQMQTYLILSDFRQKVNKKGQAYGFHIAAVETPETKWGRPHVTSAYHEDPAESWNKIQKQALTYFHDADEKDIKKLLGIKHPGENADKTAASTKRKTKSSAKKENLTTRKIRPQELPWPENLVTEIGLESALGKVEYSPLSEDQMKGLRYALSTLKDKENEIIRLRYEEHRTQREIGSRYGITGGRIGQICAKAIRKLHHRSRIRYIRYGYLGAEEKEQKDKEQLRAACESGDRTRQLQLLKEIRVGDAAFSARTYYILRRCGIETLGQILELIDNDPKELLQHPDLKEDSLLEITRKLGEYNVDCKEFRKALNIDIGEISNSVYITDLRLTIRTANALIRAGFKTIEEVKNIVEKEPERLLKIRNLGRLSRTELLDVLEQYGIDCQKARLIFRGSK